MAFRRVTFPLVKSGLIIVYPDNISLFANTVEDGDGNMIADYSGVDIAILDFSGHEPRDSEIISTKDFITRFTDGELGDIQTLAETNNVVRGWLKWISHQDEIDLEDSRIVLRVNQAETAGVLAVGRADEILFGA